MYEVVFDPRLAERLQGTARLERPPTTLREFVELGKASIAASIEIQDYLDLVRQGKKVIGETEAQRGQSVVLPDGRRVNVMCGYDMLLTSLLRGQGTIHASCFHCGEKMEVKIEDGQLASASSPSIVYWLGDSPKGIPICDHQNFFPDLEHLRGWLETNPEELGVPLRLEGAVAMFRDYLDH